VSRSFGGIVGVYQKHKFEDGMRRAMDAWAEHIERLASVGPLGNIIDLASARA